jgi:hypothetical protein
MRDFITNPLKGNKMKSTKELKVQEKVKKIKDKKKGEDIESEDEKEEEKILEEKEITKENEIENIEHDSNFNQEIIDDKNCKYIEKEKYEQYSKFLKLEKPVYLYK